MPEDISLDQSEQRIVRVPVIIRKPWTRKDLAILIARGEATPYEEQIFFESIEGAIRANVYNHGLCDSRDEVEDWVFSTYDHLKSVLHKYNPERKNEFITWMWTVVVRYILGEREKLARYRDTQQLSDTIEATPSGEYQEDEAVKVLRMDLRETVKLLLERMAHRKIWIIAMLGDPHDDNWRALGGAPNFTQVAADLGVPEQMMQIRSFWHDHVRPFLRRHLRIYS